MKSKASQFIMITEDDKLDIYKLPTYWTPTGNWGLPWEVQSFGKLCMEHGDTVGKDKVLIDTTDGHYTEIIITNSKGRVVNTLRDKIKTLQNQIDRLEHIANLINN